MRKLVFTLALALACGTATAVPADVSEAWSALMTQAYEAPYDQRLAHALKAVEMAETRTPPGQSHLAQSLVAAGLALWNTDEHARSEPYFRRALTIAETLQRVERDKVEWSALHGLVDSLVRQQKPRLTEQTRLFNLVVGRFGTESAEAAMITYDLSLTSTAMGNHAEAERLALRALAIVEKAAPAAGSEALVRSLRQTGRYYLSQKKFDLAEPYLLRAVAVDEALNLPAVGSSQNLLDLYRESGDKAKEDAAMERFKAWSKAYWQKRSRSPRKG